MWHHNYLLNLGSTLVSKCRLNFGTSKLQPRCCFTKTPLSEFGLMCFTASASKLWQNFSRWDPAKLQLQNPDQTSIYELISDIFRYSMNWVFPVQCKWLFLFLWAIATKQSVEQFKIIMRLRMVVICTNSNFKGVGNFFKVVCRSSNEVTTSWAAGWAFSSSPEASFLYYHCAGASSLT